MAQITHFKQINYKMIKTQVTNQTLEDDHLFTPLTRDYQESKRAKE